MDAVEQRIAQRLFALRAQQGWSLEDLAGRSGISRASLSRLERGELSPTAGMLGTLCAQYGWTLSRLMADAEGGPPGLVRPKDQLAWKDPGSGYDRRAISPPHPSLKGELVEVSLPPGAVVAYDTSPMQGLEHHLWMLSGALDLDVEGASYRLEKGDCLRYILSGPSRFACRGARPAKYAVCIVRP